MRWKRDKKKVTSTDLRMSTCDSGRSGGFDVGSESSSPRSRTSRGEPRRISREAKPKRATDGAIRGLGEETNGDRRV